MRGRSDSGAVSPPGGVAGEKPSTSVVTGAPATVSRASPAEKVRTSNDGVDTVNPLARSVPTTWSTAASYPGVPTARLPAFASASFSNCCRWA